MFAVDACYAAMPMAHVFAKTNIRDRDQLGALLFNRAQRFLNHAVLRVSAARLLIFFVGDSKKQNCLESCVPRGASLIDNFVDGELEDAGHARNRAAFVDLVADEKRENEIVRSQIGFADEIPQRG